MLLIRASLSWWAGLSLTALLLGSGCSSFRKQGQCKKLVDAINTGSKKSDLSVNGGGDPKKEASILRQKADVFDSIAADIKKLDISAPDLKAPTLQYMDLLTAASKTARDVANAYDKADAARARAGIDSFNKIVKEEGDLVTKINTVCTGS